MLVSNRAITAQRSSFKHISYSHDFFLLDNFFKNWPSNFPVVQWLRLHVPNAGGSGLIPDQGPKSHNSKFACYN